MAAGTEDEILGAGPQVGDVHFRIELFGQIATADPPAGLRRGRESKGRVLASVESRDIGDRRLVLESATHASERILARRRKPRFVDRLFAEDVVRGGDLRGGPEHGPADLILRHFHNGYYTKSDSAKDSLNAHQTPWR